MTNYDMNKIKLPGRKTAQRMVAEAGALVKIRAAYELHVKSLCCVTNQMEQRNT